jgi:superfamily I DNA and RNA helicase
MESSNLIKNIKQKIVNLESRQRKLVIGLSITDNL